jgi:uncharacterized protein with GYD domain
MSTFILMTKLTPEVTKEIKHRENIGKIWMKRVNEKVPGIKWVAHYALLGPYDFMDIFEAPDEEAAAKVSMITLAAGATQAESWVALPYHRFVELVDEI